jgi:hypothetical protein
LQLPSIKSALTPTWTKAIVCAFFSCAFILVEFRSPVPGPKLEPSKTSESTTERIVAIPPAALLPATPFTRSSGELVKEDSIVVKPKELAPALAKKVAVPTPEAPKKILTAQPVVKKAPYKKVAKKVTAPKTAKVARYKSNDETLDVDAPLTVEDAVAMLGRDAVAKLSPEIFTPAATQKEIELPEHVAQLIEHSFNEDSLEEDFPNWQTSAALPEDLDLEKQFPVIERNSIRMGIFEEEKFADLHESLTRLKGETLVALNELPKVSLPDFEDDGETTVVAQAETSVVSEDTLSTETEGTGPTLVMPKVPTVSAPVPKPAPSAPAESELDEVSEVAAAKTNPEGDLQEAAKAAAAAELEADDTRDLREAGIDPNVIAHPEVPVASKEVETLAANETGPNLVDPNRDFSTSAEVATHHNPNKFESPNLPPTQVGSSLVNPVGPQLVIPTPTIPSGTDVAKKSDEPAKLDPSKAVAMADKLEPGRGLTQGEDSATHARRHSMDVNAIVGKFSVDSGMETWLARNRGHIELHLEPAYRLDRSSQDNQVVDYRFPSNQYGDRFAVNPRALHGDYALYARVYMKDGIRPVASVPYRDLLNSQYRPQVAFHLRWNDFSHYYHYVQNVPDATRLVSLSLFEGAAGDPKKPTRVANASVRVVGFPEWGTFVSNEKGNVRIPNVPSHSELLLDIVADNYYSTQKIVPVFESDAYNIVYLISKDKAQAIKYWTKEDPDPEKGIIMGKAYDHTTRTPKAGEKMTLSYQKGQALYIDSLPNPLLPETTSTGLFGFFNIIPSFRALGRAFPGELPLLVYVKKNYAQWVDLGRAGVKPLPGRLYDIVNNIRPEAKIRLVGQKGTEVETDANGDFQLAVDLPEGVLPIEVESPGYMTTWHMEPYDPSERVIRRNLFQLPEELVKDSALNIAKVRSLSKLAGSVMGGAEPFMFEGRPGCNTIEILDDEGKVAGVPHAWGKPAEDPNHLCLTSDSPRFAFHNLKAGMYVLRWLDKDRRAFRSHVVYVGMDRVTMVIS